MTPPVSTSRRDRLLAVLLLLGVLLVAYFALAHWTLVEPHLALRDQLIDLRDQELRLRTAAEQRPAIAARLAEVRAAEAENPGFLPQPSFDAAVAALMQRLDAAVAELGASAARCQVNNKGAFDSREKERFKRAVVKVGMRCEIEIFAALLYKLESGSPQLFVDQLTINSSQRSPYVARANLPPGQGALAINFDLYGYLHQPGGDSGKQ